MKTFISLLLFAGLIAGLPACKKGEALLPEGDGLPGSWSFTKASETSSGQWTSIYKRAPGLSKDAPGYSFHSNGKVTVRQNAGWCGTPPITYADYDGSWSRDGDTLYLRHGYWGGEVEVKMLIVDVDRGALQLQHLSSSAL